MSAINTKEEINYLELTPVKLKQSKALETGKEAIIVPKFTNKIAVTLLKPFLKKDSFQIKLDDFGSAVWRLVDGEKKVQTIADELRKIYGSSVEPAEGRLTTFLTTLYRNEIITFSELNSKEAKNG